MHTDVYLPLRIVHPVEYQYVWLCYWTQWIIVMIQDSFTGAGDIIISKVTLNDVVNIDW